MNRDGQVQRVFDQVEAFLQANPQIAEAMRVFGMSDEQYMASLRALSAPKVFDSNSTELQRQHG